MPDKKDIPVEMEKVHRRFQRWRKTRRGRAPIPRRLWAAAASLAREHGVNPTSQALGLEFNKLRSFVGSGKTAAELLVRFEDGKDHSGAETLWHRYGSSAEGAQT